MPSLQRAGGLRFDGNSYVDCGVNISSLVSNSLSITVDFIPSNLPSKHEGIAGWRNNINGDFYILHLLGQNSLECRFRNSVGTAFTLTIPVTPSINQSVLMCYDGSNLKVYVNGLLQGSISANGIPSLNTSFFIGKNVNSSTNFLKSGTIGATRIYNRALSPSEVYNNYQGQVVRDASLVGEWLLNQAVDKRYKLQSSVTYTTTATNAIGTVTFSSNDYAVVNVGDQLGFSDPQYQFIIISKNGNNQATVKNIGTQIGGTDFGWTILDKAIDTSGNGNHGTLNGGQWVNKPAGTLRPRTAPLKSATFKRAIKYNGQDGYSFSRPSVEPYNGMTVPMDTPRVDGNGVMVEEGTSNLVKYPRVANSPSWTCPFNVGNSGSMDSTKSTPLGDTISWKASRTANYGDQRFSRYFDGLSFPSIGTYCVSAFVFTDSLTNVKLNIEPITASIVEGASTSVSMGQGWQRITLIFTVNTVGTYYINFKCDVGIGSAWMNDVQLEQKAYSTTFTDNPLGRQAETLTFPTANVLNASAGAVEMWFNPSSKLGFIQILGIGGTRYLDATTDNNSYNIFTDSANLFISIGNGTSNHLVGIPYSILSAGVPALLSVVWKTNDKATIYVNGVPKASVNTSTLSPSFSYGKVYVCGSVSGGSCPNAIVKSLRISNVARTDQEILDSYNASKVSNNLTFDDKTTKLLNFVA